MRRPGRFGRRRSSARITRVYVFADQAHLNTAMKSPGLEDLIADFDRSWPAGVTRTRDLLTLAEERAAQ